MMKNRQTKYRLSSQCQRMLKIQFVLNDSRKDESGSIVYYEAGQTYLVPYEYGRDIIDKGWGFEVANDYDCVQAVTAR